MLKFIAFILALIVITNIIGGLFFNEWYLNPHTLRTFFEITYPFIFFGLFMTIAYLFNKKGLSIAIGVFGVLLAPIFSYLSTYPLDCYWDPEETAVLKKIDANHKIIAEQYFNPKHNEYLQDTVLVQDCFIFRRVLKK